jgi:hypothetical protein
MGRTVDMKNRRSREFLALVLLLVAAAPGFGEVAPGLRPLPTKEEVWRVAKKCSVNSLYVFLRLHGQETTYEKVEERLPVRKTGTNLAEMRQCAGEFGLNSQVIKATPDMLASCPLPAIAHWEEEVGVSGHYVVLLSTKEDWVEIIDGTTGVRDYLTLVDFRKKWSGYLLVVQGPLWWRWLYLAAGVLGVIPLGLGLWWRCRGNPPEQPSPSPAPAPATPANGSA